MARCRAIPLPIHSLLIVVALSRAGTARAQYRNLDAGRPGRVEDAEPTPRYALDIDLVPFQIERLTGGTTRYRAEPRLAYGILPFTDLEVRLPIVQVNPPSASGATSAAGLAGVSIGLLRALNIETTNMPAFALAAELSLPLGGLAPARGSYLAKALLTKTTSVGRFHLNGGLGTYAIRTVSSATSGSSGCSSLRILLPGDTTCNAGPPIIIDVPCSVNPATSGTLAASSRMCAPPVTASLPSAAATPEPRSAGNRWFAGAAFDHSFALRSTLLSADVFAERFVGLYANTDWTAEIGLRHQLTPLIVLDAGAGRHFAGTIRSTFVAIGATYELATPPFLGR